MEYLSTTSYSRIKNINATDLFEELNQSGYIKREGKWWRLTKKGEKIGKYKKNDKGEKWIVWPENLDEILIKKNKNASLNKTKKIKSDNKKDNRIFPSLKHIRDSFREIHHKEELIKLADFFDKNLDKEWHIYINIKIDSIFEQNLILLHPEHGCIFFNIILWFDDSEWSYKDVKSHNDRGFKTVKRFYKDGQYINNPMKHYIDMRMRILNNAFPHISDVLPKYHKYEKFRLAFYFPNISQTQSFTSRYSEDTHIYFGKDLFGMNENKVNETFLSSSKKDKKKQRWNNDWFNILHKKFVPYYHNVEEGVKITLTPEQKRWVNPQNKIQRLEGVAGSGKTLVIAQRAAKLASEDKQVLIVTFNITLCQYIFRQIHRAQYGFFQDNIKISHFHGICKEIDNNNLNLKVNQIKNNNNDQEVIYENWDEQYYNQTWPEKIIEIINNSDSIINKYDAIIIDEGQDFHKNWYDLLKTLLKEDRKELLYVADKKQNIYKRDLSYTGRGRWGQLSRSHRLPQSSLRYINYFSNSFIHIDNEEVKPIELGVEQAFPFMGPTFQWEDIIIKKKEKSNNTTTYQICKDCNEILKEEEKNIKKCSSCIKNFSQCFNLIKKAIKSITKKANINDIIILVTNKSEIRELQNSFNDDKETESYKIMHTATRYNKTIFRLLNDHEIIDKNINSQTLRISTIHSFKGWEMPHVIILTPSPAFESASLQKSDYLMYTALTRTLCSLTVINRLDKYVDFGEYIKSENIL